MTLYPSDLAHVTPDADGVLRLYRGTAPQIKIPHPSFVGDVRMFRGTADQVGKGDLVGWALVGEIEAGTLIRVAITDAEVGVVSGSNTITVPIPTIQIPDLQIPDETPTGTVDLDHDHSGNTGNSDAGTTNAADDTSTVENDTISPVSVASATHGHTTNDHNHSISADGDTTKPLTMDPIEFAPIPFAPIDLTPPEVELNPQAIAFYLITFTGVIAA